MLALHDPQEALSLALVMETAASASHGSVIVEIATPEQRDALATPGTELPEPLNYRDFAPRLVELPDGPFGRRPQREDRGAHLARIRTRRRAAGLCSPGHL